MLKPTLFLTLALAANTAFALSVRDDFYLEKIRFLQYHIHDHGSREYKAAMTQLMRLPRPSDGVDQADLGRAFMRLQEFSYAKQVLANAVGLAPGYAPGFSDLAYVSARVTPRDCATVQWAYTRAVALDPKQADERHVLQAKQTCNVVSP